MTREEAIRILNNIKPLDTTKTIPAYMKGQAFDMAIQALKQNESAEEWYKLFVEKLEQEQEPKIGYWINHKDEHQCSNCSEVVTGDWDEEYMYDYCPNCGARMVEPQESEE